MRVQLIYPPISRWDRYSSDIGNAGGRQVPLGVFYLAAYLRQHGHRVGVIDAEALELSSRAAAEQALAFRPEAVGISATTVAFHRACEVARRLKHLAPGLPLILGGPHVTAAPEDAMQAQPFDYGVVGEGEETLQALLETLAQGGHPGRVEGIVWRSDGKPRVNPPRPYIPDLDRLPPPAYDLVPDLSVYNPPPCNYQRLPVVNVITSRGCPSRCTFCDRSVFGQRLRTRSAENIAAEIDLLYHRYGMREIAFVDDTFTLRPHRIRELFELLDQKKIRCPWTCMSRINTVDYDLLKFMRRSGCWHVSFGIESGDPEILETIQKRISLDQTRRVVAWCRSLGILTKGFFIVGHPGETPDTIERSIRFALELPLDDVVVTLNTPLPGTEQYANAHRYGRLERTDWSRFNMWNPVFVPRGLTRDLLLRKHREFYRRFYLRPRPMARYLGSFCSPAGLRRAHALVLSLPFLIGRQRTKIKAQGA